MKNIILLCVCSIMLAGCGATTAPGTLPADSNQVTVVDEFARLDLLSGLKVGAIENLAENGLTAGDIAAMKAALVSRLKQEGLLFEEARPQSGILSLQVVDVVQLADGTAVTVRMLLQDRQNWLVLGSADVIGRAPRGDVRGAALAATDGVLDCVIVKMKRPTS